MHDLTELADFLAAEFRTNHYPESERGGLYRPSNRPVQRLGLALEPFPELTAWVETARLDALWLHRPWQLDPTKLPSDVGVLSHHLPFDEALTIGLNPYLAPLLDAVGLPEPLGFKRDSDSDLLPRAIGMLIDVPGCEFDAQLLTVNTSFGGYDRAEPGRQPRISRVAVVGAMNDALVREAANRGANLYLTGQYRKPAQDAVDETGMAVIAIGHRRTELWGLRALANILHEHYPHLSVLVRD